MPAEDLGTVPRNANRVSILLPESISFTHTEQAEFTGLVSLYYSGPGGFP